MFQTTIRYMMLFRCMMMMITEFIRNILSISCFIHIGNWIKIGTKLNPYLDFNQ